MLLLPFITLTLLRQVQKKKKKKTHTQHSCHGAYHLYLLLGFVVSDLIFRFLIHLSQFHKWYKTVFPSFSCVYPVFPPLIEETILPPLYSLSSSIIN